MAKDYSSASEEEQLKNGELTPKQMMQILNLDPKIYKIEKNFSGDAVNTAKKKYKNVQISQYELYKRENGKWVKVKWNNAFLNKQGLNNYAIYGENGIVIVRPFSLAKTNGIKDVGAPGLGGSGDEEYSFSYSDDGLLEQQVNYEVKAFHGDDEKLIRNLAYAKISLLKECYESAGLLLNCDNFLDIFFNDRIKLKRISITDKADNQKIFYMNRLIENPIITGGDSMLTPAVGGSGIFTGKAENEKLAMCGINGDWSPQSALARGLIGEFSVPCPPGKIQFNKYAINDLVAILTEIKQQIPWYDLYISSHFRTNISAGGHSRHQVGLAVDINAGGRGNPWFNVRIPRGNSEPQAGSSPPWPMKDCPYRGTYNRKRCIWHWGHPVVKIFESHGWGWGGSYGDVMHFSIDGR